MPNKDFLSRITVTMFREKRTKSTEGPRPNFSQGTIRLNDEHSVPFTGVYDFALNGEDGYLCLRYYEPGVAEEKDVTIHLARRLNNYDHKIWFFKCQKCNRLSKGLYFWKRLFVCRKHLFTEYYRKKNITVEAIRKDLSAQSMQKRLSALVKYLELKRRIRNGRV